MKKRRKVLTRKVIIHLVVLHRVGYKRWIRKMMDSTGRCISFSDKMQCYVYAWKKNKRMEYREQS